MSRFILPIILIGISIAIFFTFLDPLYSEITERRTEQGSYDEALNNSKALENERDKLTQKYNSISSDNLDKLNKLLPENVDNIRLILEIEKMALPYGMILKDVRYNVVDTSITSPPSGAIQGGYAGTPLRDYGGWDLEFSVAGSYDNFINFTKDLESNLRIVDIMSVEFSSDVSMDPLIFPRESYQYKFKIKTYLLKN